MPTQSESNLLQRASLLGLPPELRASIYEFTLYNVKIKLGPRLKYFDSSAWALLSTCQQLREEAFPVFFDMVQFEIRDQFTEDRLWEMLAAIGAEAVSKMKKIDFWVLGKCSLFGFQPDTDYCHRVAVIDLSQPPPTYVRGNRHRFVISGTEQWPGEVCRIACSNRAYSCSERNRRRWDAAEAVAGWASAQDPKITESDVVEAWKALSVDNGDDEDDGYQDDASQA